MTGVMLTGDPCEQQKQLEEGDMNECTEYTRYNFFSGSEVSYIGSLTAVGLLPFSEYNTQ